MSSIVLFATATILLCSADPNELLVSIPAADAANQIQTERQSKAALQALAEYLSAPANNRTALADQAFAATPLTSADAAAARTALAEDRLNQVRAERAAEMQSKLLQIDDHKMPFYFRHFGKKPKDGWSLYISLHGGGGTAAAVNDRQWENQKRLYQPAEGIYVAPRAPTDTWNLWHQGHIDHLLDRLIEDMVAFEDVNWNRVYLMGYSAGGDGVFQLAPRMADRWAAAAMMAGHPNETSPLGLRNVPFALQVGGRDTAYNRSQVAVAWQQKLARLQADDPDGYVHFVKIYPDKGHWMDREDAVALPWMAQRQRNPVPKRIVWMQDDVTHSQFYWLRVDDANRQARSEITAQVEEQTIMLSCCQIKRLTVLLDDRFIDLDQPIRIESKGTVLLVGRVKRTIASLANCLAHCGDPHLCFPASVSVAWPADPVVPN